MSSSRFWKLSAELRNEIYDLASITTGGIFIELVPVVHEEWRWRIKPHTCPPHILALTEVSKSMRNEALGALFAVNDVSLIMPMHATTQRGDILAADFADQIRGWLHALHIKERSALRLIELDLGTLTYSAHIGERHFAAALHNLAMEFCAVGVTAKVWIGLPDMDPHEIRRAVTVSFTLSASSPVELRAQHESHMARLKAQVDSGSVPRSLYDIRYDLLKRCLRPLELLADNLERFIAGRLVSIERLQTR